MKKRQKILSGEVEHPARNLAIRGGKVMRVIVTMAVLTAIPATTMVASAHPPADPLHGGTGAGVKVLGHTDLGGQGLNGHVDVLGDHAYVGAGTNGGFAAQWNKTPSCRNTNGPVSTVKVVKVADSGNPTVVSTITIGNKEVVPRDVDAIRVKAVTSEQMAGTAFVGDLLAVGVERCNNRNASGSEAGVRFYNVNNPANPIFLGRTVRFNPSAPNFALFSAGVRQVSVVQRPDGRVLALEANQQGATFGGGVFVADVTDPSSPADVGRFGFANTVSNPVQECRPFVLAQGVSVNEQGSRAYVSYQDEGTLTLDLSALPPAGASPITLPVINQHKYSPEEEGNTFRNVPRDDDEDVALVTDEDAHPAKTTLTVTEGPVSDFQDPSGNLPPGVIRGCEAIWGAGAPNTGPLFRRATPSVTAEVTAIAPPQSGCSTDQYAGLDVAGKIVLVQRGGTPFCGFEEKARFAQDPNQDGNLSDGAAGLLISNTFLDHHGGQAGFLFATDSNTAVDGGGTPFGRGTTTAIKIPVVFTTLEAGQAIRAAIGDEETVTGTLADSPDTWGALRIFDISGPNPIQTAVVDAPNTTSMVPGNGIYHAVNPIWRGNQALVAWMSDGLRVVDVQNPLTPKNRAYYVPPAVPDPTGNYGTVPLVVDVARISGSKFAMSDINGGLYILDVALNKQQCSNKPDPAACEALFSDVPPLWTPSASLGHSSGLLPGEHGSNMGGAGHDDPDSDS